MSDKTLGERLTYWWWYKLDDGNRVFYAMVAFFFITFVLLAGFAWVEGGLVSKCLIPTPARTYETK